MVGATLAVAPLAAPATINLLGTRKGCRYGSGAGKISPFPHSPLTVPSTPSLAY